MASCYIKQTIFLLIASMYRLHNTSEHGSGVTNMYSLSNAASRAATPLQIGGNDHLVLIASGNHDHMHHHHHHHHAGWYQGQDGCGIFSRRG